MNLTIAKRHKSQHTQAESKQLFSANTSRHNSKSITQPCQWLFSKCFTQNVTHFYQPSYLSQEMRKSKAISLVYQKHKMSVHKPKPIKTQLKIYSVPKQQQSSKKLKIQRNPQKAQFSSNKEAFETERESFNPTSATGSTQQIKKSNTSDRNPLKNFRLDKKSSPKLKISDKFKSIIVKEQMKRQKKSNLLLQKVVQQKLAQISKYQLVQRSRQINFQAKDKTNRKLLFIEKSQKQQISKVEQKQKQQYQNVENDDKKTCQRPVSFGDKPSIFKQVQGSAKMSQGGYYGQYSQQSVVLQKGINMFLAPQNKNYKLT